MSEVFHPLCSSYLLVRMHSGSICTSGSACRTAELHADMGLKTACLLRNVSAVERNAFEMQLDHISVDPLASARRGDAIMCVPVCSQLFWFKANVRKFAQIWFLRQIYLCMLTNLCFPVCCELALCMSSMKNTSDLILKGNWKTSLASPLWISVIIM